jgi:eukaryotic-like serine/threonine-protein kinase
MIAGRYRIERLLAKGGMGSVYVAVDTKLSTTVAVKLSRCADPVFRRRFQREARIGNLLGRHSGFVRAIDWGEFDDGEDTLYLVMDLIEDASPLDMATGSLRERLARMAKATSLVAEAHRNGIIHRDLKPHNFLQTPDGEIYLTDFGLAKIPEEDGVPDTGTNLEEAESGSVTLTGAGLGTPMFMSPEQFSDAKHVSRSADVYSLGVMLFKSLTGRYPFDGKNFAAIHLKQEEVRRGKLSAPSVRVHVPEIPEPVDRLCGRALSVDASQRPTADELLQGLQSAERAKPKPTPEPAPEPEPTPRVASAPTRRPSAKTAQPETVSAAASGTPRARASNSERTRAAGSDRVRIDAVISGKGIRTGFYTRRARGRLVIGVLGVGLLAGCGSFVLDLGAVQAFLPGGWQVSAGEMTRAAYARLSNEQLAHIDTRPPQAAVQGATPDWTSEQVATLRIVVDDAALFELTVNGASVPFVNDAWRHTVTHEQHLYLGENRIRGLAVDRAGNRTEFEHGVVRVDPTKFLTATRRGASVVGKLSPRLAGEVLVAGRACSVDASGGFTAPIQSGDVDPIRVEVRSPRHDVVELYVVLEADESP